MDERTASATAPAASAKKAESTLKQRFDYLLSQIDMVSQHPKPQVIKVLTELVREACLASPTAELIDRLGQAIVRRILEIEKMPDETPEQTEQVKRNGLEALIWVANEARMAGLIPHEIDREMVFIGARKRRNEWTEKGKMIIGREKSRVIEVTKMTLDEKRYANKVRGCNIQKACLWLAEFFLVDDGWWGIVLSHAGIDVVLSHSSNALPSWGSRMTRLTYIDWEKLITTASHLIPELNDLYLPARGAGGVVRLLPVNWVARYVTKDTISTNLTRLDIAHAIRQNAQDLEYNVCTIQKFGMGERDGTDDLLDILDWRGVGAPSGGSSTDS